MMLFLTLVVPPAVFRSVGRKDAGRIMSRVFPPYYGASLVLPAAALLALLPEVLRSRSARVTAATLAVAVGTAAANALVIRPRIDRAMALMESPGGISDPQITATFGRLHVMSVAVVVFLMILALVVLAIEVAVAPRDLSPSG
jgi:hypothetical protein